MSKQDKIAEIVKRVSKKPAAPDPEESLFDSGYLDSFALTDMVTELEHEFGLKIPDSDLNPRRFESIARIERYLDSKGNLAGAGRLGCQAADHPINSSYRTPNWLRFSLSAVTSPSESSVTTNFPEP
jgi:acyl carrier protein